jgi:HK97 family phage portal protein
VAKKRKGKGPTPPKTPQVSGIDFEKAIREVAQMQMATAHIPALVQQEIQKGWKQLPNTDPKSAPKSWFADPLSLQYSLGYKDRRFSLTYDTLKRISGQLSIISAIIATRSAQVAAFSEPYRKTRSLGFAIKHKDDDHETTPAEIAFIKELEQFVANCGRAEQNPYSKIRRDDFETFLRKIVRDTLTYDSVTFEVVPDNMAIPYEFLAVDASTIRIASDNKTIGVNNSWHSRDGFVPNSPSRFANAYSGREYGQDSTLEDSVAYVQVINGQINQIFNASEMAFGVRNPRTDLLTQGYGYGELEQLITIITSHLNAEAYNANFFKNGSIQKGILNLKGDNWSPETLEAFQRNWAANVQGVDNAFKTPVLQSEGIEWIDLHKGNAEMEYGKYVEYLLKIICAVYLIDPAELNFDMHGGVQQTPLFESSQEWKLKASRDRGLKPLLKFIAKLINKHIIDKIDDHFTFEFVGLDELSEKEKHEMIVEQISSYLTLNEARRKMDLPDLPGGDFPLNPVYLQAMQAQREADQQESQQNQQVSPDEEQQDPQAQGQLPGSDPEAEEASPQYSYNFNKF